VPFEAVLACMLSGYMYTAPGSWLISFVYHRYLALHTRKSTFLLFEA
jgi:hypothetical protein